MPGLSISFQETGVEVEGNKGNTAIVIEHNLEVIKNADWVIDLGPEGGDKGGRIIATGTPEQIACNPESLTGQFLKGKVR